MFGSLYVFCIVCLAVSPSPGVSTEGLHLFSYVYCLYTFSFGFADVATSGELYTSWPRLQKRPSEGFY